MKDLINRSLDRLANYFAHRKGLLPILGLFLIVLNGILQFLPTNGVFIIEANLFLHLGLIIAIVGILLAWSL